MLRRNSALHTLVARKANPFIRTITKSFAPLAIVSVLCANSGWAANDTWSGNTSANWNVPANWAAGVIPVSGDTLSFGAAGTAGTALNNNLTVDTAIGLISFNGPGSFAIGGNEIQLIGTGNGIINNSTVSDAINTPLVVGATRNITLTSGGGSISLGGTITGPGGLTTVVIGTAAPPVLTLGGANGYTGGTTVANGTVLNLANANAAQNSTVTLNTINSNGLTFAPGIGTFNLGALASAGASGDMLLSDGTSPVTLSVGLNNASTTYNGSMSGAGSLVKVGTGTLTMAGAEIFTGSTTVNNGGLTLSGSTFGSTALTLGGGTVTVNNAATTPSFSSTTLNSGASAITDTLGTISLGNITRNVGSTVNLTLTVSNVTASSGTANTILTDSGVAYATVGGTDWAAKNAAGNLVGLSTITGGYTATTATTLAGNADVAAGVNTTLGGNATITSLRFNQAQARTISLGTSTLVTGGILNTATVGANLSTISGGTLEGAAGKDLVVIQNDTGTTGTMTISSAIADNGSATGLTKAGGGILALTGANLYTGTTRVNAGTLQFTNLGNLGTGPIVLDSGTLQYATGSTVDISSRSITFTPGNGSIGGAIDTNGNNVTFANVIGTGSTGSVIKAGAGTLTLTAANAINNSVNLALVPTVRVDNGGTLQLGNANTVQNGTIQVNNTVQNNFVSALGFSPSIGTFNIGGLQGSGEFTLADTSGAPVTISVGGNNVISNFNGGLVGSGNLVKVGTGTLNLSNSISIFTGNITVNGGVLQASTGNNNGTNDGRSSTLGAFLVPGRTITVNNGGSLVFTSNNIFGNGTGARGSGPNIIPITVNAGGTLATTRYDVIGNVTLNGGTMYQSSSDSGGFEGWQFLGTITAGGTSPSSIVSTNVKGNHLYFNTTFNVADATGNSSPDLLVPSILENQSGDFGSAAGSLTKTGVGTMLMSGANVYTGNTTISAGTLLLGGKTVASTTDTGSLVVNSQQVTGLVTGTAGLIVGQSVSGTGIPGSSRIQSIDGPNQITINQPINANGTGVALTFGAAAPLGLGATSTVTVASGATLDSTAVTGGVTLANNQRIVVNGTVNGGLNLPNGNTLQGTGTLGAVSSTTSTVAPGSSGVGSIGTLSMSSFNMSGGTLAAEFSSTGGDKVNVSGAATFSSGGSLLVGFGGTAPPTASSFDVVTAGSISGTLPTITTSSGTATLGRTTFSIDNTAPSNVLRVKLTGNAANVTWTGASGNWDAAQTDANWTTTDAGVADKTHYYDGDYVTLNDSNGGHYGVTFTNNVSPTLVTVNNSSGDYSFSGGAGIVGNTALIKNGTGALNINQVNSYTGGSTINAGNVLLNANNSLGTGPITLNGGTLIVNNAAALGNGPLTINGGALDNTSGSPATISPGANGPVNMVWGGNFSFLGFTDLNLGTGTTTLNSNPTINLAGAPLTIGGPIRDGSGNSITYTGTGTVALTGASEYTGPTTIGSGVTARGGNNNAFGANPGQPVTVQAGGTIDVNGTGAGNDSRNFGRKLFIIAGDGVNNLGALTNSVSGSSQNSSFQLVTLSADASFGGAGRFDIRSLGQQSGVNQAVLDLAGHTLTNNNTNFLGMVGVEVTDGNIVSNAGNFDFETTTNIKDFGTGKTITFGPGALGSFFNYTGTLSRPIIMNAGARLATNGGGNDTAAVASPMTLAGNAIFTAINGNGAGTITLNGVVSETGGSFGITKNVNGTGNSILALGAANTFTGGVIINGGIVQLNNAGALNSTTPNTVTLNAGASAVAPRLRLNGNSVTVNGITSTGSTTALSALVENASTAPATLTVNIGGNPSFDGIMQNGTPATGTAAALSLTTTGSGTFTLTGANTFTGPTTVGAGGTLQVGTGGATGSIASSISGVAGTTVDFNRTADLTLASAISGGIAVSKDGPNALTLSGTNTYTGATNVNSGTLVVTGALGSTTVNVKTGAVLSGNGTAGDVVMASGSGIRPGANALDGSAGTVKLNSLTVNGGDYRADLQAGIDLINVTGTANFTGPSTITPVGAAATAGTYTILSAGTLTVGTTPTLVLPPQTRFSFSLISNPGANGTLQINQVGTSGSLIWKGNVNSGGNFLWDVNTTQNFTLSGNPSTFFNLDSVTFDDTATNKTVTLNASVVPFAMTVNNSAGNYTFTGTGSITGTTGITKTGTGTLTLATSNTYTGVTAIQNGTLAVGTATALPSNARVVLGSGTTSGTLDLNGNSPVLASLTTSGTGTANTVGNGAAGTQSTLSISGPATFGGNIVDVLGASAGQTVGVTVPTGTVILTGTNTYTGQTTVPAGATLQVGSGGTTGNLGTTPAAVDGTLAFNRSNGSSFNGTVTGAGSIQNLGAGITTLTGANTNTGVTTIAAGALQLGDPTVNSGTTGSLGTASITDNGTLIFNRSDDPSTPVAFPNVINGTGGITKNGASAVTLTGANTFTGNVVVNSGILEPNVGNVNNSQNGGQFGALGRFDALGTTRTITVNAGAELRFLINNIFGNQTDDSTIQRDAGGNAVTSGGTLGVIVVANADGRNLPKIILNGGTLNSASHYNQIGTVTLNSGATLIQTGEQPNGSTGYDGWQFLGDFNVGGNAPSTISTNNGSYNHLGINTTFNVADVTGNASPDLIVSAGLRNRSGDYGTGVGNFIKTGFGTMLISAMNTPTGQNYANTYTGSTTVNQGTLSVGMANGINAASALILGGGKFDTGGFNQTMNTLTLNATSAIDMGTQSAIMTFASSAANTWSAGKVLSIDNWSGSLTGGGTDQLIVGTTTGGLTAAQLSEIHFQGFNGAKILANGEVVPASASTRLLGDFNFDGHVNAADLTAAMTALSDLNAFKSSGSLSSEDLLNVADVDGSGAVNNADLQGLITYLQTGHGSLAPVPEPATGVLGLIGAAAGLLVYRRRRTKS